MGEEQRAELLRTATPRIVEPYIPHMPHPPQALFLCLNGVEEVFYGGAAGGGKSDALLMAALQYVDVPGYSALILRRTFADLTLPGAIMDRAWEWLSPTDAKSIAGGRTWKFPSGARLTFGHAQHHKDVEQYRSAEFQFVAFDELTQFAERTYEFLFSRLRRPKVVCIRCSEPLYHAGQSMWLHDRTRSSGGECDEPAPSKDVGESAMDGSVITEVPLRMRSASNPGGYGHAWVRDRLVKPDTKRPEAAFVPAILEDNPSLDQESYRRSLEHLGPTERARLLRGDWNVVEEGSMFRRWWFHVIKPEAVPAGLAWVRYWDLAASSSDRSDWTAGALVAQADGVWYVCDIARIRGSPRTVEQFIASTAAEDEGRMGRVQIHMEQEGGASGVNTIDHYRRRVLAGYPFYADSPNRSKVDRAAPVSSAAEAGNVTLVEGAWNRDFLDEAELFPQGEHDDQVDALSGAVKILSKRGPARARVPSDHASRIPSPAGGVG